MKTLTVRSVDTDLNLVEINDGVLVGYEHFCSIADTLPYKGDVYKYEGSAQMGGQLTKATKIQS
jgi:hypothetical protein